MSEKTLNLANAIQDRFKSCDRKQLEEAAEMVEVEFHPSIGDDKLRRRILERLNMVLEDSALEVPAPKGPQRFEDVMPSQLKDTELAALYRLNLHPRGRWEGRRRLVTVPKPENMKGQQGMPFTWNNFQVIIPWNTKVSVPYPIYHILKNAKYFDIEQERVTDRRGTPKIVNHRVPGQRFQYSDIGDDPETAHLPRSQKEQFRMIVEATDHLKGWERPKLARIAKRMGLRYRQGLPDEDVRDIILRAVGIDPDFLEGSDNVFEGEAA